MKSLHRRGAALLLATALVAGTALFAQSAGAYPAGTAAVITTSTSTVDAGGSLTVDGQNFVPNATVTLTPKGGLPFRIRELS